MANLDINLTGVEATANKGIANGYGSLDANGKQPSSQLNYEGLADQRYSGQWKGFPVFTAVGVTSSWNGFIYTTPFIIGKACTVTQIRIAVTTGAGSGLLRLGLYADNNGLPGALIEGSGDIDASGTGEKSFIFTNPISLSGKRVYMAITTNNAAIAIRFITSVFGVYSRTSGSAHFARVISSAFTYGALPSTFPSPTENAALTMPDIQLLMQ